jgi:hypothetical protein
MNAGNRPILMRRLRLLSATFPDSLERYELTVALDYVSRGEPWELTPESQAFIDAFTEAAKQGPATLEEWLAAHQGLG